MVSTRTRGVSPDKTACSRRTEEARKPVPAKLPKDQTGPFGSSGFFVVPHRSSPAPDPRLEPLLYQILAELLLKYQLQQPYDGRPNPYSTARSLHYNRGTGNASVNAPPFISLVATDPGSFPDAAGIRSEGDEMLRDLIYNDLMARGKTEAVAKEWGAVAAEFERVCGLKERYNRADVTAFLAHLRKRGLQQSTINKDLKAVKLLAQIQGWQFPKLSLKHVSPDEVRRTVLSKQTVGSMITLGKQGVLSGTELCYLALATTYGLRRIEMVRLKPSSFVDERHLVVDTAKGGSRTIHLIPPQIAPYLASFRHYEADSLTHMFHRIAQKVGLSTESGYGWHSIRRALATELILLEASALNVLRFMRWSDASTRGEFGMLTIYAKKDQERIDTEMFKIHPFLPFWGESRD